MARRSLRIVVASVAAAGVLAAAALLAARFTPRTPTAEPRTLPPETVAPEGVRIRVQVLNATATRGLARRATLFLRDRGFDVVEMGTAAEQLDSTLVLDRSGHPDWARRVAAALGATRVASRPDSSRYLDVTVLVGRAWRPPAQPFYP